MLEAVAPCAAKADAHGWKITQQGFTQVSQAVRQAGAHASQVTCAKMLRAIDLDMPKIGCALDLTSAEHAALQATIDAFYAERTPVVPTGDAASDAVIARVAHARDAMCACTTLACQTKVDASLDQLGALPDGAPQAARDLGSKLLDDLGRCEARLRELGH